jgi:histidine ammonia-lyase
MDSTPLTAAIDMLRQTLTMAASVSTERALKQQNAGFSGLPVGLSSSTGAGGGMGALMIAYFATARQTAMRGLAAPVLLDSGHAVADGIEDVAGSGPLSVQRTAEVAELCWQIVTVEILTALWALSLRDIHPNSIGAQLRPLAAKILPRLPIGREGESVFDLTPLVEIVRKTISTQGSTHAV